jgi:hypothetical protein
MYRFQTQRNRGYEGEKMLDGVFSRFFNVRRATASQQRDGIDRVMVGKEHGQQITVEYKTDYTAASSGNAFVEIAFDGRPGWAHTSQADFIAYCVPGKHTYIVRPQTLRTHLSEWEGRFEKRTVLNAGYTATGLIVPLAYLAEIAEAIYAV